LASCAALYWRHGDYDLPSRYDADWPALPINNDHTGPALAEQKPGDFGQARRGGGERRIGGHVAAHLVHPRRLLVHDLPIAPNAGRLNPALALVVSDPTQEVCRGKYAHAAPEPIDDNCLVRSLPG
jgi:hypothetical protein